MVGGGQDLVIPKLLTVRTGRDKQPPNDFLLPEDRLDCQQPLVRRLFRAALGKNQFFGGLEAVLGLRTAPPPRTVLFSQSSSPNLPQAPKTI